jgi:hypothetical protein
MNDQFRKITAKEQRMILHEMFAATVSNAPDNETDNFTAKRISPIYLSICKVLEKISKKKKKK